MADNKVSWKFLGDARDLVQATRGANRGLKDTEDQSSRTDRAMANMDDTIRNMAIGLGAAEIAKFALESIKMGEAATQVAESAEEVLGGALDSLHERLDGTRQLMGLNVLELDTMAAKYGLLTEGMGLNDEAQAAFIETLVTVGGDLAAFNGRLDESGEAIDALGSAVKGEFDALENWGLKINAAAVEAKALELVAAGVTEGMSEQEIQLMALTELINEQAAPALGSLADAQDTAAAKQNELTTKWEDAQIKIGQFLAPALTWLLDLVLNAIDAWDRLTDAQEFWNTRLGHWTRSVLDFVETVLTPFRIAIEAIAKAFAVAKDAAGGFADFVSNIKVPNLTGWVPSWVPGFAKGGRVGGPKGQPRMIIAHGGEEVDNPDMGGGGGRGGGITIIVNAGVGDPQAIGRAIVESLQVYEQTNGALPLTVTQVEST